MLIQFNSSSSSLQLCAAMYPDIYWNKFFNVHTVAFWVTNPCRITRKVEQTKMYVCTLEEFILVDIWIHCCTWMN